MTSDTENPYETLRQGLIYGRWKSDERLIPQHLKEVKSRKEKWVNKTVAAVKERLTVEINHWDHRAEQLKQQELAGKINARINSVKARQRADELTSRLQKRMADLQQDCQRRPNNQTFYRLCMDEVENHPALLLPLVLQQIVLNMPLRQQG